MTAVRSSDASRTGRVVTVLSWNLLHSTGAVTADVARLIASARPDIVAMQEATDHIDSLPELLGGGYARAPLPGRAHGVACWSRTGFDRPPFVLPLPAGAFVRRVCLVVQVDGLSLVNAHLSHGQLLNRRQLRTIAATLPAQAVVVGDFNLVGPVLLPHFRDVGPRSPTHRMADLVPLRIDRCLARGVTCEAAVRLARVRSDHHPILVRLRVT